MAAAQKDHDTTLMTVAGGEQTARYLLANLAPPDHAPDAIWSVVYELKDDDFDPYYEVEAWLTALRMAPGGKLMAVSMDGDLHTRGAAGWSVRDLKCEYGLNDLWIADDGFAVAVGQEGMRVIIGARSADATPDPAQRRLYRVHGLSRDHIYAVGDDGVIWFYDGKSWQEEQSPTNAALFAVLCRDGKRTLIGGYGGVLFEHTRGGWLQHKVPKPIAIYSMVEYKNTVYMACGKDGVWTLKNDKVAKVKDLKLRLLSVGGDKLWGTGGTFLVDFDGTDWLGSELDI
jgi:photosystem II stability/assembly factor-like uncharacterized protein